jgi:hypothetical protein
MVIKINFRLNKGAEEGSQFALNSFPIFNQVRGAHVSKVAATIKSSVVDIAAACPNAMSIVPSLCESIGIFVKY